MLPRPRVVCQEPGLRPISLIPDVPINPTKAWVAIYKILCGWGGSSAIMEWAPLLLLSEWGANNRQWNLPASFAGRSSTEVLLGWPHWKNCHAIEKMTDNTDEIYNNVTIINLVIKRRDSPCIATMPQQNVVIHSRLAADNVFNFSVWFLQLTSWIFF